MSDETASTSPSESDLLPEALHTFLPVVHTRTGKYHFWFGRRRANYFRAAESVCFRLLVIRRVRSAPLDLLRGGGARTEHVLKGDCVVWIPSGWRYSLRLPTETFMIEFALNHEWAARQCALLPAEPLVGSLRDYAIRETLVGDSFIKLSHSTEEDRSEDYQELLCSTLCKSLLYAQGHWSPRTRSVISLPDEIERKARAFMEAEMRDPYLTPRRVADHVGISPEHFARRLKASSGFRPVMYLQQLRALKAVSLLRSGVYNVGEVAEECGFLNQGAMTYAFLARWGAPPKAYLPTSGKAQGEDLHGPESDEEPRPPFH